jgi:AhpD family alkylhydroperoxidase
MTANAKMMATRTNILKDAPEAYRAMRGLENYITASGLDRGLYELIKIRASQINGCSYCLNMHTRDARRLGETEKRIYLLNAWRDTELFTDKERAALALTESITLIAAGGVPDEVYQEAARHFEPAELAAVIMAVVTINGWNRIQITSQAPLED